MTIEIFFYFNFNNSLDDEFFFVVLLEHKCELFDVSLLLNTFKYIWEYLATVLSASKSTYTNSLVKNTTNLSHSHSLRASLSITNKFLISICTWGKITNQYVGQLIIKIIYCFSSVIMEIKENSNCTLHSLCFNIAFASTQSMENMQYGRMLRSQQLFFVFVCMHHSIIPYSRPSDRVAKFSLRV